MSENQANLIEIFQSRQGEGPHLGEPMIFVRFQDCALSCRYCDTPASFQKWPKFRLEEQPHSGEFQKIANPIDGPGLNKLLAKFSCDTLSLTGGEPLQHEKFLRHWLPQLEGKYRILLETNGVLPRELEKVIHWVDIVSMDLKLPSATGMPSYWEEHAAFLEIAREKEVYVKVVVATPTTKEEIGRALDLVSEISPTIPFILQPVTPFGSVTEPIPQNQLDDFFEMSKAHLPDVRVIPQMHPIWGIL